MPAQILATADTAASSLDITVTSTLAVCLKEVSGPRCQVSILLKDDAGNYNQIGALTGSSPATVISAPGVYRFTRLAGASCGVFSG